MVRAFREDAVVTEAIAAYQNGFPRTTELWDGVRWTLSRMPQIGQQIGAGYVLKTAEYSSPAIPVLTVYYTFDDAEVRIIAVQRENPGDY